MSLSKKNLTYLRKARSRIHGAQNWRKTEGYDELWDRLNDLYRGKHFGELDGSDKIAINIAFATINVIGPSISVNHPNITVNSRLPENEDRAVIVEAVTNYWWRTKEIKPEFRRTVKDYLIFGFGFLKTGYRFVEEETDRPPEDVQADIETQMQEADAYATENPDMAGDLPTNDDISANVAYTEMKVVEDRPFAERVSVHDIFVNPDATSMEDVRWIAQRCLKDVEEVRSNKNYKGYRKEVKADALIKEEMRDPKSNDKDLDAARITVWEYYDVKDGTMAVFTEQGDDFLVDPMDQPYVFGHPFLMLRNYEVPDMFYPIGELEAIEPLQLELDKTRSQQMNDRKRYARKYLYDGRAFDQTAIGNLQSQRDGEFVKVNEGVPLDEAVLPLPQTPLDSSIYQMSEQVLNDMSTVSGISEYQRGGAEQNIRRTATEASMIQDAANSRAADKLAAVEEYIGQIAKRLIMLSQQYMTEPQVARIVGGNDAPIWFEFEPSWIQGEYDFEVEGGSTQPLNEQARRQQAMDMMQVVGPLMQSGMINVPELLKHVLKSFGIKNPSKFLVAPPAGIDPQTGLPINPTQDPNADPNAPIEGPPDQEAIPLSPEGAPGVPDMNALLAQLQGQVGLQLPTE